MEAIGGLFCFVSFIALVLFAQVFWLWMLIECLVKEPSDSSDKLLWALVIFFGNLLGAILYFVIRRPERIDRFGG